MYVEQRAVGVKNECIEFHGHSVCPSPAGLNVKATWLSLTAAKQTRNLLPRAPLRGHRAPWSFYSSGLGGRRDGLAIVVLGNFLDFRALQRHLAARLGVLELDRPGDAGLADVGGVVLCARRGVTHHVVAAEASGKKHHEHCRSEQSLSEYHARSLKSSWQSKRILP